MMEALRLMHAGFPTRCPYDSLYDRYKVRFVTCLVLVLVLMFCRPLQDVMPRAVAALDSCSFCEILLMALGLDKADYQLGITKVFFRAGEVRRVWCSACFPGFAG